MSRHFYGELEFPATEKGPFVACNMVVSLDGKVTADGRQPSSLGSSFDALTMNVIRSHFDAVLAGGNTIRQFPFYLGVRPELTVIRETKGLESQPLTIILTQSGELPVNGSLFKNPPRPPLIITSQVGAQKLAKTVVAQSTVEILEELNAANISSLLSEKYQVQRLLIEGGPSVNYQFIQAILLRELFLTISPQLIGKRTDLSLAMGDQVLDSASEVKLLSVNQHDNEVFLRYRFSW